MRKCGARRCDSEFDKIYFVDRSISVYPKLPFITIYLFIYLRRTFLTTSIGQIYFY